MNYMYDQQLHHSEMEYYDDDNDETNNNPTIQRRPLEHANASQDNWRNEKLTIQLEFKHTAIPQMSRIVDRNPAAHTKKTDETQSVLMSMPKQTRKWQPKFANCN